MWKQGPCRYKCQVSRDDIILDLRRALNEIIGILIRKGTFIWEIAFSGRQNLRGSPCIYGRTFVLPKNCDIKRPVIFLLPEPCVDHPKRLSDPWPVWRVPGPRRIHWFLCSKRPSWTGAISTKWLPDLLHAQLFCGDAAISAKGTGIETSCCTIS